MAGQDQPPQGYGPGREQPPPWGWGETQSGTPSSGWTPPVPAPAPRRPKVWPVVVAASVVAVAMLAAAITVGRPLLSRLLPGLPLPGFTVPTELPVPGSSGSSDYSRGAKHSWTLDLKKQFPDSPGARFSFGPDLDDASSMFRFGVVDAQSAWVTNVWLGGGQSSFIGIDPSSGAVLWTKRGQSAEGCVSGGRPGSLACVFRQKDAATFAFLDAVTGAVSGERTLPPWSYLTADASTIVVGSANTGADTIDVLGLDWTGATRWQATVAGADGFQDVGVSMTQDHGTVAVANNKGWTAFDAASGKVLAASRGWLSVTPDGRLITAPGSVTQRDAAAQIIEGDFVSQAASEDGPWALFRVRPGLAWCADHSPASCRDLGLGDAQLDGAVTRAGVGYAVARTSDGTRVTFINLATGATTGTVTADQLAFVSMPGAGGAVVVGQAGGRLALADPSTGAVLGSAVMSGWSATVSMPRKVVLMHSPPEAGGIAMADAIAVYDPADSVEGWVAPGSQGGSASAPSLPSGIPECPSGSVKLAFATFTDGWVLVCGVDEGTPTSWAWSIGGVRQSSASVTRHQSTGRYVAVLDGGSTAWISPAPAMVGSADAAGVLTLERTVGQIWFVSHGSALPTTGASGVAVPQQTDVDQIRYLSQILAKSTAGRAALVPAVNALAGCSHGAAPGGYAAEVATIDAVSQNRAELLDALQTAPVDRVPDGVRLVNQLVAGLRLSWQADQAFGTWARVINASGCPSGSAAQGESLSEQAGVQKTAFAQAWNSTIAPRYGVPTVSRETL